MGIRQDIRHAKDANAIEAGIARVMTYPDASHRTRVRCRRAAEVRARELAEEKKNEVDHKKRRDQVRLQRAAQPQAANAPRQAPARRP